MILVNPVAYDGDDPDVRLTPHWLWSALDDEFSFTIDAAANAQTTKCALWLGPGSAIDEDALTVRALDLAGESVWLNPPFSRLTEFVGWAARIGALVPLVAVVPGNRHEQQWWHEAVIGCAAEVRVPRGRVAYGGTGTSPEWPSLVLVYRPGYVGPTTMRSL